MNNELKQPKLTLSAAPVQPSILKRFFEHGEDTPMHLLEHPTSFRYAGWDLETLDRARIKEGQYWEVVNGERKTIRLYEDGTLLFTVWADNSFLGWGQDSDSFRGNPRLNSLALVEATTNFVFFYNQLIQYFEEKPSDIQFKIKFSNMILENGKSIYLDPAPVGALFRTPFSEQEFKATKDIIENDKVLKTDLIESRPEIAAYKVLERIFLCFNTPTNKIPYTGEVDGTKYVDIEAFKKN